MAALARYITPTLLIPLAVLTALFCFVGYYWHVVSPRRGTPEWIALRTSPFRRTFCHKRHPMTRKDALPLLLVTAVYAFTAFFQLGSFTAPQSARNLGDGETVEIALSDEVYLTKFWYYSGLGTGDYNVEISSDGEHWSTLWARTDEAGEVTGYYWADAEGYSPSYDLPQHYADLFKWLEIEPENPQYVRYLRITGDADRYDLLELGELVLFGAGGEIVSPWDSTEPLFDEADTVPESPSWYNSTYFDEIYHARTAYEHIRNVYPYEISHPPLGKLFLSLGIRLFGMTPFGWRCVGALFGVLMLPILYVFLKNLFGKTVISLCGTALFAFDFMHLTQTRIATIDTYAVFFILGMYFFLYRFLTLPPGTSFARCALPLFLSGLFWGVGAASKWTVIYGGVGLAILYFIGVWYKWRDWPVQPPEGGARAVRFGPWLVKTLLFSVLCFVILPFFIYTLSYWPYAIARGNEGGLLDILGEIARFPVDQLPQLLQEYLRPLSEGEEHTFPISSSSDNIVDIMLSNANYMFTYHSGVDSYHPYASRWYQWIVDARPILYYQEYSADGAWKSAFAAFNNPVVCWTGLLAILSLLAQPVLSFLEWLTRPLRSLLVRLLPGQRLLCLDGPVLPAFRLDGTGLFILIGYFSQLAPWFLISRTTFEYHYFPSLIFLVLAICYLMDRIVDRAPGRWKGPVYGLTIGAVVVFALFYPALIGLDMPVWYASGFLKWLPSWPL